MVCLCMEINDFSFFKFKRYSGYHLSLHVVGICVFNVACSVCLNWSEVNLSVRNVLLPITLYAFSPFYSNFQVSVVCKHSNQLSTFKLFPDSFLLFFLFFPVYQTSIVKEIGKILCGHSCCLSQRWSWISSYNPFFP